MEMEEEGKNPKNEFPIDRYHPIEDWIEEEEEEEKKSTGGKGVIIILTLLLSLSLLFIAAVMIPTFPGRNYLPLPGEEALKKELTKANKEIEVLKANLAQADELRSSLIKKKEESSALSSNIVELRGIVLSLRNQLKEREKKIASLERERENYQKEKKNLLAEVSQLRSELSSQEEEILNLKKEISIKEKRINSLLTDLKKAENKVNEITAELKRREEIFQRKSKEDEEAVAAILKDAKRLSARAEKAEAKVRKQEKELKMLRVQLAALKAEMERVEEGDLVRLTKDVIPPKPIRTPAPNYPSKASDKKLNDTVYLRVLISEDGEVLKAKVVRLSHPGYGFEKEALKAVKRWHFTPAIKKGKRVMVWKEIAIRFQYEGR